MSKNGKTGSRELLDDFRMLDRMAADLKEHQKRVLEIGKRISKAAKSDVNYGLLEDLDIIATHMNKAHKEIVRAKKKLRNV
jgi:hypothetical protein